MKKYGYIIKRYLKILGIIPNNCIYCLKDLELEKLKINSKKNENNNIVQFEYICEECFEDYKKKFEIYVENVEFLREKHIKNIKHIYLGKYNMIKDKIMDIKYFDKQYILKGIIEITIEDIIKNIIGFDINKINNNVKIIMIYIPTTLKKKIERGNISKYICDKIKYEIDKKKYSENIGIFKDIEIEKICNISKVKKDIEIKKLNKEERNIKVKEKYVYLKDNFLEKYIKEKINSNNFSHNHNLKIIIVDDVYTTGSTMKNVVEMIEKNILKEIEEMKRIGEIKEEKDKTLNIEYIFLSLAKD